MQPITAVPTHIITGFLGAGKTTLLNGLLSQKPLGETWAVLVNEFGKIGIDQALIHEQDGIAIKEVIGGCLCCTSQLPMQVALVRLLQQTKPDRLFIEPTGLAHADQLIAQLSQSHWQNSLKLHAVLCVVSSSMLLDQRYMQHATLLSQLDVSDILMISQASQMTSQHEAALQQLLRQYPKFVDKYYRVDNGQLDFSLINHLPVHKTIAKRSLLNPLLNTANQNQMPQEVKMQQEENLTEPPYHYVEQALEHEVAGWCLPPDWQFDQHKLIQCLLKATDWLRIKGVLHTEQGWIAINFTPTQLNYQSHDGLSDNRLEVIVSKKNPAFEQDWQAFEQQLLDCLYMRC